MSRLFTFCSYYYFYWLHKEAYFMLADNGILYRLKVQDFLL